MVTYEFKTSAQSDNITGIFRSKQCDDRSIPWKI